MTAQGRGRPDPSLRQDREHPFRAAPGPLPIGAADLGPDGEASGAPAHFVALVDDMDGCKRSRLALQEARDRYLQVADMLAALLARRTGAA